MGIRKRKTPATWIAVLLASALVLASCGSDDTTEPEEEAEATETGEEPEEEAAPDGAEGEEGEDAAESDDPMADLIAAAQEEGTVMLYTAWVAAAGDNIREAFAEQYGIDVQVLRLASSAVTSRFAEEEESQVYVADVLATSNIDVFRQDESENGPLFVDLAEEDLPLYGEWPDCCKNPRSMGYTITPMTFAYNTDLISEDELPQSWSDLTDPKWAGRLAASDPRSTAGTAAFYEMMIQEEGEQWLQDLAANDLTVVDSVAPGAQQVAAGEFAAVFPANDGHIAGLDTVASHEMEWTSGWLVEAGLAQNAPHPNAGRLLMHWLMTEEGQAALNGPPIHRVSPMYDDIEGAIPLPAGFRSPDPLTAGQKMDEYAALLGLN